MYIYIYTSATLRHLAICPTRHVFSRILLKNQVGSWGTYGKKRNACRVLVVKPERKRPLRRTRPAWENIQIDPARYDGRRRLDSSGSRQKKAVGSFQNNKQTSCSTMCEIFCKLRNYCLLEKGFAP